MEVRGSRPVRRMIVALSVFAVLALPAPATAHVELSPEEVTPGSFTLFTVLSPNESEKPLTGLRLTIPADLIVDSIADMPGFESEVIEDQSHRITALSWQGGTVAPEHLALFRFSASVGSEAGPLRLTAVQTFGDGSMRTWQSPVIDVAGAESGASDTPARVLGAVGVALAVLSLALGALLWQRRTSR